MLESSKILHLASANCEWEAAVNIATLAAGLREHGLFSAITAPEHSRLQEVAEAAGVEVIPYSLGGTVNPLRWLQLSRLIKEREFEFVHAHDVEAATMLSRAGLFGKSVGVATTRYDLRRPPSSVEFDSGVDVIICPSQALADIFAKTERRGNVKVVYDGVNINLANLALEDRSVLRTKFRDDYCKHKEKPLFIVNIAPLEKESRHSLLLEAMTEIVVVRPQAHLIIMGEGSLAQELVRQCKVFALSKDVTFLEPDKAFVRLLAAADLYVSPSLEDISGFMIQAAMATGTATVLTRTGCFPEMIEDGRTGVFVAENGEQPLRTAMVDLLENRHHRESVGKQAKQRAAKMFNNTVQSGMVAEIYREVLSGKK